MKRIKNPVILPAIAALVLTLGPAAFPQQKAAPSFALFNTDGKLVTSGSLYKSSNCVVAFWASYCAPCKREMPSLIELERKYNKTKNITLVLISIDTEGREKAVQALKALGIEHECLLDIYQVAVKKFSPSLKIPATFLINRNGRILFQAVGESGENPANLEKAVAALP